MLDAYYGICGLKFVSLFFFNDTATTEIYTLSLHDALPIYQVDAELAGGVGEGAADFTVVVGDRVEDRKSTRLNSSHVKISYAVFCLKKKKKKYDQISVFREISGSNSYVWFDRFVYNNQVPA